MRFVHAADIHLDSPLRGLESYPGAPADRLRIATRQAFERVVDLCLEEHVDFLLIAGDLFDTDIKDFNAALAAATQLRRLNQFQIPVYLILGNHDSREEMTRHVPWPENVVVFDHKRAQTIRHPRLSVAIHGISYAKREITNNLVPGYPLPVEGCFNIGLLHTNAGGNSTHAAYAPCSVEELVAKGYDYWALGHVHDHAVLHERPHVVYSGNTQGRHVREVGAKGCLLVEVDSVGQLQSFEFRETDVVRWRHEQIELSPDCDEEGLLDATRQHLQEVMASLEGKLAAVRLEFHGRCAVHSQLVKDASRQQYIANIRAIASDLGNDIWIEKIAFKTQPSLDLLAMRERQDLIGQLLRDVDGLCGELQPLHSLPEAKDVATKLGAELSQIGEGDGGFRLDDPERNRTWLKEAEALLMSLLVKTGGDDQ